MKKFIVFIIAIVFLASCSEDETSPTKVVFPSAEFTIGESDGLVTLGVALDHPAASEMTIELEVSGGTATEGEDFIFGETSVTIPAGETNGVFEITAKKDVALEDDETIIVGVASATGISDVAATYTITIADDDCEFDFIGGLGGQDGNFDGIDYVGTADVVVAQDGANYTIDGLNADFILNIWGEEVQTSVPVTFSIDGEGNITIEEQYIFTTLYNGNLYDYNIVGTGSFDSCAGTITIDYEMIQDGFEVGAWLHDNGYMTDTVFKAILSPL